MYSSLSGPSNSSLTHRQKADVAPEKEEERDVAKLSKAERKAKHVELNRQLWDSAYVYLTRASAPD